MKKNLLYSTVALALVAMMFASCSQETRPQFAGRYHPKIQNMQTVSETGKQVNRKEEISTLAALPEEQPVFASVDIQPQIIAEPNLIPQVSHCYTPTKEVKATNAITPANTNAIKADKTIVAANTTTIAHKTSHHWFSSLLRHGDQLLSVIVAIFLPFVGVAIWENAITVHFWIALILSILFWLPGFIYALIIILGNG